MTTGHGTARTSPAKYLLARAFRASVPGIGRAARAWTRGEALPSIPTRTATGVRLLADPWHHTDQIILRTGTYEAEVLTPLLDHLNPGDVFWDIGANTGFHSLSVKSVLPTVTVYAFEPAPVTFARLQRNAALNDADIHLLNCALSDEEGYSMLHVIERGNSGLSSLAPSAAVSYQGSITCRNEIGDHLVESGLAQAPNVIKVDVEGFELHVLRGLRSCLADDRLSAVIIEGPADLPSSPVADVLRACGVGHLRPVGDEFNWIATRGD